MAKSIFYNKEFELNGVTVPEFELRSGNLIRIYIPNFGAQNQTLGLDFTLDLIKRFQSQKTDFPWTKIYRQNTVSEFLNSLTVSKYLIKKMQIDKLTAKKITEEIGIDLHEKFEYLSFKYKKGINYKSLF